MLQSSGAYETTCLFTVIFKIHAQGSMFKDSMLIFLCNAHQSIVNANYFTKSGIKGLRVPHVAVWSTSRLLISDACFIPLF